MLSSILSPIEKFISIPFNWIFIDLQRGGGTPFLSHPQTKKQTKKTPTNIVENPMNYEWLMLLYIYLLDVICKINKQINK